MTQTKTDKGIKKILNAWIGKGILPDKYMKRLGEDLTKYFRLNPPK